MSSIKFIEYKNYHIVLIFVGIAIVLFSNYSNSTNGVSTRFSENYNYLEKYYSYTAQREIVDRDLCNQSKKYKDFKSFCNLNYKEGNKNLLNKVIFRNFVKKFFQTYAG